MSKNVRFDARARARESLAPADRLGTRSSRRVAARAAVKAPGAIENEGIYAAPQPDDVLAGQRIHIEIYRSGTRSQCSKARAAHRLGCEQPPKFWGLYIGRAPASLQGAIATLAPLRV